MLTTGISVCTGDIFRLWLLDVIADFVFISTTSLLQPANKVAIIRSNMRKILLMIKVGRLLTRGSAAAI
jgi:hypothetical protein